MTATRVQGRCPACGSESLILGDGGHLTCGRLDCPNPVAADEILSDGEIHHIVTFGERDFAVKHPLVERVGGALMRCGLPIALRSMSGPPAPAGSVWRVVRGEPGVSPIWERLDGGS